ncbi:MAG: caspase family protein [Ardenticatenaceae bacterium]
MSDFIYRGPLAANSPLFRGRQAELAQLSKLCRGEVRAYAIVYGGRQMGKTSLLLRLPTILPEWVHFCRIDFQAIPSATTAETYAYIAERITRTFDLAHLAHLAHKNVSNSTTLIDFLCDAVKGLGGHQLVLCLEQLGAVEEATRKELANVLRYIFTNRSDPALRPLSRLMIIIAGTLELYDLATVQVSPLYNICEGVYLSDLSKAEAVGLVADGLASLNLPHAKAQALGQAIYAQVSGYPYLTQRLGSALATNAAQGESLPVAHVKKAAEALQRDDPLLLHLRKALQENDLLAACEELLTGEVQFSRLDEEMSQLELLGLAKEVNGHWQVRNLLFGSAIQTWLAAEKRKASAKEKPPAARPSFYGTGKRWAVLVGVNEYEDKANYARLPVCVKDMHAIRQQLIAGGFDPAHIRLLGDDTPELPTRVNTLLALKSVADATDADDLLIFYYSGHGSEDARESYLVGRDGWRLLLSDTAVPVSRIKEIMEQAPARAKVLILDACHSGADLGTKGAKPMSAEFIRRVFEQAEGLAILASCKQKQFSYVWGAQQCSVFTHYLLEALRGEADRDNKGFVTVQDANRHVTNGVKLWASQIGVSQTPTLQYSVAGDIILVRHK